MERHFVTFYSPGTFLAETTTKPIESWDVALALQMMKTIEERYGARPYGFRFATRGRGPDDLDSREIDTSPMHYVDVEVLTREQVEARGDPRDEILLSNMRINNYDRVVTTTRGWRWTQPIRLDDIILSSTPHD